MGGPNISWLPMFLQEFPDAVRFRDEIEGLWDMAVWDAQRAQEREDENLRLHEELKSYRENEKTFENQRKFYQGVLKDHLETSTAYANLIISAGYAGLFATWTLTLDNLSPVQSALIGGLALLSLLFFVGWELAKMIYGAWDAHRYSRLLEIRGEAFGPAHLELDKQQEANQRLFGRWWIVAMLGALLPGLASGLILMGLLWARTLAAI